MSLKATFFYQNPVGKYMNRSPNQFTDKCMKDTMSSV